MINAILNQYRVGSSYKDTIGDVYHYPKKYQKSFSVLPLRFVYYEPRAGGEQVYFGAGTINVVDEDTEEPGHFYADVSSYRE